MPIAFPSHPGLLAPLWRIWPRRFDVLALWSGALAPDLVDGVASLVLRGHFGHWFGHSLLGCVTVDLGVALALARLVASDSARRAGRVRLAAWLSGIAGTPATTGRVPSAVLGALTHLLFDAFSHDHTELFLPLAKDPRWFPGWWYHAWTHVDAPGYPEYPIGPAFVVWVMLSLVGAWMFFRWPPRSSEPGAAW